ncbi:MAG: DUF2330 domain-containing protein [bacterium]
MSHGFDSNFSRLLNRAGATDRRFIHSWKFLFVALIFLLVAIAIQREAAADGLSIGLYGAYTELSQKAVIICGASQETLYLSTTFKSDVPLADQVWIVPVLSKTPPVVEKGDHNMFEILPYAIAYAIHDRERNRGYAGRVIVYKETQLDIYNTAVIEVDTLAELVGWLESKGYIVPDGVKPLLDYYVQKDAYFVVNRIDLKTKHSKNYGKIEFYKNFGNLSLKEQYDVLDGIRITSAFGENFNYESSDLKSLISKSEFVALRQLYERAHEEGIERPEEQERLGKYYEKEYEITRWIYDLRSDIYGLIYGYATPIKITSQPEECNFPLVISSGSKDALMEIQLAVFGSSVMKDVSGILRNEVKSPYGGIVDYGFLSEPFDANENFLAQYLESSETEGMKHVTYYWWQTRPASLTKDAVFTSDDGVAFDITKGMNIVGNPFNRNLYANELVKDNQAFWVYDPAVENGWGRREYLLPCEAGMLHSSEIFRVIINSEKADKNTCLAAYAKNKGWRLVAKPGFLSQDRFDNKPLFFRPSRKEYMESDVGIDGMGYWIYFK